MDPNDRPPPTHAILAIDILMQRDRGQGGDLWRSKDCWTFSLEDPRALGELDACARALAEEHGGRSRHFESADGSHIFSVTAFCTDVSFPRNRTGPRDPLGSSTIVFAALHAWGCGPHSGARAFGPGAPWAPEALEARMMAWILDSEISEPGSAPRSKRAL